MSNRIHVATRKGLFTVERGAGATWAVTQAAFLGDTLTIVMHDPRDRTLHAALHHGHFGVKMHRSPDGGKSWEEFPAPAYPPAPEGVEDRDMWGKPLPWKLDRVWALEPGHASQPGRLWCGTIPGGLFRSDDGGGSWELVRSLWDDPRRKKWFGGGADLPGIHSICVHPRDANRVTLGVSCGGVWVTEDSGNTWDCRADGMWAAYMPPEQKHDPLIQDPHCVVQCREQPECLWAQHHNGVFRSTDGAGSWHDVGEVPPSAFGFAVAVHPRDPDTAWLIPGINDERRIPVGGRVVVTRTRDGGRSWDVLRNGLPQEHAYDLTFRHALDIDGSGECLAFGSTTGSLWVTNDQGDSWQCVSAHLPPIYCVRFEK
jgi:photosystem II stability/assembly factor-like uncharacterized protein